MAKKFDLYQELLANGFYEVHDEWGGLLRRDFDREIDVLWYGKQKDHYIVRARFNPGHTSVSVHYYHSEVPARPVKIKTHLNEKRALNAIIATVNNAGFEF